VKLLPVKLPIKITRKRFVIGLVFLVVIFGIFIFNQRTKQKPLEYTEVKRQTIVSSISASGVLAGKETANLRFKSPGKLAYINVKAGDKVFTGQTLASLDTTDLSITLQQTENNLKDKQTTLDKIYDDIHLFQYGNMGTNGETEAQRALRTTAEVARDNTYDTVRAAREALLNASIFSPISGIVTRTDITAGQVVSTTDLITQVVDISELYFDAEVDESDISKISLGQKARVTLNSYNDKGFTGTVSQIKPITKTASSGATVVIIRIKLDNPKIDFISDLNGQAEIEINHSENALSIPQDALVDEKYVYTQNGKGVKKVEVKTGISSDIDIEIKSGLSENEKVVKNPGNVVNK